MDPGFIEVAWATFAIRHISVEEELVVDTASIVAMVEPTTRESKSQKKHLTWEIVWVQVELSVVSSNTPESKFRKKYPP